MGITQSVCLSLCPSENIFLLAHLLQDNWSDIFETLLRCSPNGLVVTCLPYPPSIPHHLIPPPPHPTQSNPHPTLSHPTTTLPALPYPNLLWPHFPTTTWLPTPPHHTPSTLPSPPPPHCTPQLPPHPNSAFPIPSHHTPPHHSKPYPTLPYPALPYPTLPYPTLPHPNLPHPTPTYLPHPIPTYPITPHQPQLGLQMPVRKLSSAYDRW